MLDVIHCDRCLDILISPQRFCSRCKKPRDSITWPDCDLESPLWEHRERIRDGAGSGLGGFIHCDHCFSVMLSYSNFCGFCAKPARDIEWQGCELDTDAGAAEWMRREGLRIAADRAWRADPAKPLPYWQVDGAKGRR